MVRSFLLLIFDDDPERVCFKMAVQGKALLCEVISGSISQDPTKRIGFLCRDVSGSTRLWYRMAAHFFMPIPLAACCRAHVFSERRAVHSSCGGAVWAAGRLCKLLAAIHPSQQGVSLHRSPFHCQNLSRCRKTATSYLSPALYSAMRRLST